MIISCIYIFSYFCKFLHIILFSYIQETWIIVMFLSGTYNECTLGWPSSHGVTQAGLKFWIFCDSWDYRRVPSHQAVLMERSFPMNISCLLMSLFWKFVYVVFLLFTNCVYFYHYVDEYMKCLCEAHCRGAHVEVRGILGGVSCCLPSFCQFWGLSSDCQSFAIEYLYPMNHFVRLSFVFINWGTFEYLQVTPPFHGE